MEFHPSQPEKEKQEYRQERAKAPGALRQRSQAHRQAGQLWPVLSKQPGRKPGEEEGLAGLLPTPQPGESEIWADVHMADTGDTTKISPPTREVRKPG